LNRIRKPKNLDADTEIEGSFIWLRGYKVCNASMARRLARWLLRAADYLDYKDRKRLETQWN
jgi:hypothetical protein